MKSSHLLLGTALALCLASNSAQAEIKIGVDLALTGPNASLGIPYRKGLDAFPKEIGGESVTLIVLDDGSDPSTAVKNAQKLINDDKVDLLIGPSSTPAVFAIAPVATSSHVPQIALSPVELGAKEAEWVVTIPQPGSIWIQPILKDMAKRSVKTVAFIGFSDPWGDRCFNSLRNAAAAYNIEIVADERYARTDSSVTGQPPNLIREIFPPYYETPSALAADRRRKPRTRTRS